ncbi:uncharacterized protein LOC123673255 [Harmonia axyridis]|uniref:uncharacterized protein LOC123673255 n=1 Tax=Harmonia axyridis TaxID=115357 RepID=UPI001E2758D2|nr:uncharacterized protein LOC123673255 [Harmonia axyridis]
MFKNVLILAVVIGCAIATPIPDAKATPKSKAAAKPELLVPLAAPSVAYTANVPASFAYSSYVSPYAATYPAYSPYDAYSAPLIYVVLFIAFLGCTLGSPVPEADAKAQPIPAAKPHFVESVVLPAVAYSDDYTGHVDYIPSYFDTHVDSHIVNHQFFKLSTNVRIKMMKYFALFFIIGCALAIPEAKPVPEAKAEAKPSVFAPIVSPAVAYTAAYSAPLAYSAYSPYVAPYAAAYTAYSPYAAYSAPLVVV